MRRKEREDARVLTAEVRGGGMPGVDVEAILVDDRGKQVRFTLVDDGLTLDFDARELRAALDGAAR
jgi:hypothetical protein